MTPDELFSATPRSDIAQVKRKGKKKPHRKTFDEIEAITGVRPKHTHVHPVEFYGAKEHARRNHAYEYAKRAKSKRYDRLHNRKATHYIYIKNNPLAVKTCTICTKTYAISSFDRIKDPKKGKDVRRPYCFLCRRKLNKEAYQRRKNANNTTAVH